MFVFKDKDTTFGTTYYLEESVDNITCLKNKLCEKYPYLQNFRIELTKYSNYSYYIEKYDPNTINNKNLFKFKENLSGDIYEIYTNNKEYEVIWLKLELCKKYQFLINYQIKIYKGNNHLSDNETLSCNDINIYLFKYLSNNTIEEISNRINTIEKYNPYTTYQQIQRNLFKFKGNSSGYIYEIYSDQKECEVIWFKSKLCKKYPFLKYFQIEIYKRNKHLKDNDMINCNDINFYLFKFLSLNLIEEMMKKVCHPRYIHLFDDLFD